MATALDTQPLPSTPTIALDAATIEALADALAPRLKELVPDPAAPDDWLDARKAAAYLDIPYSTFRKHSAAGRIEGQQDPCDALGPGRRMYFQRSYLDAWRRGETG